MQPIIRNISINNSKASIYYYPDSPSIFYIANLKVPKNERGTGLGVSMLLSCEALCEQFGATCIRLWVKNGTWMHDWYKRIGYKDIGLHEDSNYMWMEKKVNKSCPAYL